MKNRPKLLEMTRLAVLALLLVSCGDNDDPVNPGDRLCGGESGFATRVEGRSSPVEVCSSDNSTFVAYSTGNRYAIQATTTLNSTLFQFDLEVPHRTDFPVVLTPTHDQAVAASDDFLVWLYYQEVPQSGEELESYEITGGSFTLSFSDTNVLTATFENITMKIRTQSTPPEDRGTRLLKEGFISLSVDD